MHLDRRPSPVRCGLVWAATSAVAAVVAALVLPVLGEAVASAGAGGMAAAPADVVLVWLCAAGALAATAWGWAATTLVLTDAVRGRERDRSGLPVWARRGVLVLSGAAVTTALATAPTGLAHADGAATSAGPGVLAGLRLPERIGVPPALVLHGPHAPAAPHAPHARTRVPAPSAGGLVVRPGDSLWSLTARLLGPEATEADVAASWPRLYARNRATIGPDPDVLLPGQRLSLSADGGRHVVR